MAKELTNMSRLTGASRRPSLDSIMDSGVTWEEGLPNEREKTEEFVPGYHVADIPKGELGDPSKIQEEFMEFLDAIDQDCKVMALVELSDMIGAIAAFLTKYFPGMSIEDLVKMSQITARAFRAGER